MKMALEATGGMTVQTDTFHNPVFRDSLQRVFAKPGDTGHMGLASNAIFEVLWLAAALPSLCRKCSLAAQSAHTSHCGLTSHALIMGLGPVCVHLADASEARSRPEARIESRKRRRCAADHPVAGREGGGRAGAGGAGRQKEHRRG